MYTKKTAATIAAVQVTIERLLDTQEHDVGVRVRLEAIARDLYQVGTIVTAILAAQARDGRHGIV